MAEGDTDYNAAIDDFLSEGDEPVAEPKEEKAAPKEQAKPKAEPKTAKVEKAPAKPAAPEAEEASDESETPEEPVAPKDGPWKAELAQRGIDSPEVNAYMSEVVQPYITRLEQQGGEIAGMFQGDAQAAGIAAGILQQLDENPAQTIANLIEALDVDADEINGAFSQDDAEDAQPEGAPAPETEGAQPEETPEQKWTRERMAEDEDARHSEAYSNYMKVLAEEIPGFDETFYSLCLAATGDPDAAMELYQNQSENYVQKPQAPAPPVMGRNRPGSAPQQPSKTYEGEKGWKGLDNAMDDLFADEAAKKGR